MPPRESFDASRRRFLGRCCGYAALVAALPQALACGDAEPQPWFEVSLADLPEGQRVVVVDGEHPYELLRRGASVRARSLLCTHQGCEIQWVEAEDHYFCPCHEGTFDDRGQPRFGPPRRPLREHAARIEGDLVRIERQAIGVEA